MTSPSTPPAPAGQPAPAPVLGGLAETRTLTGLGAPADSAGHDTDVLVVGAGPFGATTAMALAQLGVRVRMVNMFGWVANGPRAHITSQRAMEVMRDLGVEEQVKQVGTPAEVMGDCVLATSLTGVEIARMPSWGTGDERRGDYLQHSPCTYLDVPQPRIEPIIVGGAAAAGTRISFHTEFVTFTQDDDGVTSTLRDVESGREYTVRSRYLVGADGARSHVADIAGLPIEGHVARAGTVYTRFRADLTQYVAHRPSILHWFFNPVGGFGEIGLGLLRCVTPWTDWIAGAGYDISKGEPDLSEESALQRIRALVGDPDLDVEIIGSSPWFVNQQYALEYSAGRVFCGGDATHRHPPSSGLGLNTCVQDAHNLAWKLAYVVRGWAGPGLLDSYTPERAPVGKQIVLRANQSRLDYKALRDCLPTDGDGDPVDNALNRLNAPTPEGVALRERLNEALLLKEHEWNAEGVEKNIRYTSGAVLPDPGAGDEDWPRDVELYHQPTTRPGAKLPHAWLVDTRGRKLSTLDITGRGRVTLVTGLAGRAWKNAADALKHEWLTCTVIGAPGTADPYYAWHRIREIHDAGALLVRPDGYVAWRHTAPVWDTDEATELLRQALTAVLDLDHAQPHGDAR
ncbi:FAD-dependent monooxygenase [Kineosporia sp. R_H_3]|uniref:FAD-dependent oxidoreductase n=1 Tax=Kineosporia sp. R_H_3 TaxID=1961848 RepID=UPI000B4B7DFC|nr:FAD-dependent monooxygenase [Kineosporia sp. R_H_3]